MAYVGKEKKAKIVAALKGAVPKGWKYSLAVRHHAAIVLTIYSAPFDLIGAFKTTRYFDPKTAKHTTVNPYHYRDHFEDEVVTEVFAKILDALNLDNHDNSDIQTDYFDVGHYVDINIGNWERPFGITGELAKEAA